PYAIRSRFIFSVSHICHQANRVRLSKWKDDLPNDKSINFKTMEKKCSSWTNYPVFKAKLAKIADEKFNMGTLEFRHKFHHRIPVSIEIGLTGLISREKSENGKVSYGFGGTGPISIDKLVPLLKGQYLNVALCFEKYQLLVKEQIDEIF
ncbi:hypothetical protein ACFL6I_27675, partial [candidate division KSB1 bacterium]